VGQVRRLPFRHRVGMLVRRAVALRCPQCGQGPLFESWFAMHDTCGVCGLRFEREEGYFVGAIYVNYAVTAVASLGGAIALDVAFGIPVWAQLTIAGVLAVLVPIVFFRYSRSFWLCIDHLATSADEAMERRGRRPE
jgi:uncharacterized protein (DUF983 family)